MKKNITFLLLVLAILGWGTSLSGQEKKKSSIVKVTASTYDKEIEKGVVLIDYWATWCPPCRKLNPILEEIAKEYEGKVKIGKLDVDANRKFVASQKIQSVPTLILYKNGKEIGRIVGGTSKESLKKILDGQITATGRASRNVNRE